MLPSGIQLSAKHILTGPDGTRAVFNDQTDPDYVGVLTAVTGLDSPDVRENAEEIVEDDGGLHGAFYYGRRPVTLTGLVLNPASPTDRNNRVQKITQATNAMRGDATLTWTPDGSVAQYIKLRRAQPLRFEGAWQKTCQIGMVAADPRIYSSTLYTTTVAASSNSANIGRSYDRVYPLSYGLAAPNGQILATNNGNASSYPVVTFAGPGVNPVITNMTNGKSVSLIYTLGAGETLVVDFLNHTVLLNNQASRYGAVDFANTDWWGLEPGVNDLRFAFTSFASPAGVTVQWRDAWL